MTVQLQFPEPVEGAFEETAGQAAKEHGMGLAEANTEPDWAAACQNAIALMAARGVPFQAADMIAEGLIDEPDSPARWGAQFGVAARRGIIRQHGYAPSRRATVHKSICKTWVGARAAQAGAAA